MIKSNNNYSEYFIDYAKKWGVSNGATVVADSFMYFNTQVDPGDSNVVMDLLQYDTKQPFGAGQFNNKCVFFGSWTMTILCNVFALAGGVAVYGYNSYALNFGSQASPIVSQSFAAADPTVDGIAPNNVVAVPSTRLFQYQDMGLGNYLLAYASGAGNNYQIYIQFDGVRISW